MFFSKKSKPDLYRRRKTCYNDRRVMTLAEQSRRKLLSEKLLREGQDALTDTELLELLIGFGTLAVDAPALVQIAEKEYGSPTGLFDALDTTDRPLSGAGESVDLLLKLVPTLCRRSLAEQIRGKPTVRSFEDAKELLRRYYIGVTREVAMVLYLNDRDRVIGTLYFGSGSGNSVQLDPRAIFTKAKELNAGRLILSHIHPGGENKPSKADYSVTIDLVRTMRELGIGVVDHLVFSRDDCTSMAALDKTGKLFGFAPYAKQHVQE